MLPLPAVLGNVPLFVTIEALNVSVRGSTLLLLDIFLVRFI